MFETTHLLYTKIRFEKRTLKYNSLLELFPLKQNNIFRTSSSRCDESPRDDEVVIVVPTDREDTPPRLVTDSSGI